MTDKTLPDGIELRVIEFAPSQFALAEEADGEFPWHGGPSYRSREAAAIAIPKQAAFLKRFWQQQLEKRDNAVVVEGTHYRLGDDKGPRQYRGMGGREFKFEDLTTGEVITSTDVWFQGKVPDFYREFFPNTHKPA